VLTLDFDTGRLRATQAATRPLVYLDQWAWMRLARTPAEAKLFVDSLKERDGCLAVSEMNRLELAFVGDLDRLRACEDLIRKLLPNVCFIEYDPAAVTREENAILDGRSLSAPFLSDRLVNQYVEHPRVGVDPLDPELFFLSLRLPGTPDGLKEAKLLLAKRLREAIDTARSQYASNPSAKKEIRRGATGKAVMHPTRYVFESCIYGIIKDRLNLEDANHTIDFFHAVVPLSYCDFVLLDKAWAERARQVQAELEKKGLLTHRATVVSERSAGDLPSMIRAFTLTGSSE
jgi:hypothetical protein